MGKCRSLLLNMLSRLVITFLSRSKYLLISWLQSPSAVILEPPKIKSDTASTVSPSISHEVMRPVETVSDYFFLAPKSLYCLFTSSPTSPNPNHRFWFHYYDRHVLCIYLYTLYWCRMHHIDIFVMKGVLAYERLISDLYTTKKKLHVLSFPHWFLGTFKF